MPRQSIAKSTQWVLVGKVLATILQMVTNVFLARKLGPTEFGTFGLVNSIAITLSGIAGLGMSDAAYKFVAEYFARDRQRGEHYLRVILWTQLLLGSVFIAGAWLSHGYWEARVFPGAVSLKMVGLCLLLAWVNVFISFLLATLSGLQLFREVNLLSVLQYVVIISVVLWAVRWGAGGAVSAYLLGAVAVLGGGGFILAREGAAVFRPPALRDFADLRQVLPFSAPSWGTFWVVGPLITAASVYLASTPDGAHQLGLFNTANTLRSLIMFLPASIAPVIGTAIVQEGGVLGDPESYRRLLMNSYAALSFLGLGVLIVFLFAGDLAFKVYGKDFSGAYKAFIPLAVAGAITSLLPPLNYSLLAKSKMFWLLGLMFVKASLLFGLTKLLATDYGALGLAWATLAAEFLFCALNVEVGVWTKILPSVTRYIIYALCLAFGLLLTLAWVLPEKGRWAVALPLCLLSMVVVLHLHPPLAEQLTGAAPGFAKPFVRRSLRLMAEFAV